METMATTCHSLDRFYHINGDTFERQYKEVLSGYRQWSELSHADEWLIFPENIGRRLCIDETSMSNGELYTIVTNPDENLAVDVDIKAGWISLTDGHPKKGGG